MITDKKLDAIEAAAAAVVSGSRMLVIDDPPAVLALVEEVRRLSGQIGNAKRVSRECFHHTVRERDEARKDATRRADEMMSAHKERIRAESRLDEAMAMLRRVEWSSECNGDPCCPMCEAVHGTGGHDDDCELAALLHDDTPSGGR